MVTDLPTFTWRDSRGAPAMKGPLELSLDDIQEKLLVECGINCLLHRNATGMAAFFAVTTCRQYPRVQTAADAAARLAARLPHVLAVSRFAHYMKALMRDRFQAPKSREECERILNDWIAGYVAQADSAAVEVQVRYPLRYGRVEVDDISGEPGRFRAAAYLWPALQLFDAGAQVRVDVDLPPSLRDTYALRPRPMKEGNPQPERPVTAAQRVCYRCGKAIAPGESVYHAYLQDQGGCEELLVFACRECYSLRKPAGGA
jgi:type VI secretion system protein ImpC